MVLRHRSNKRESKVCFTLGTRAIKTAGFAVCNIFGPVKLGDWAQIIFSVRCRDQPFFTKPNDDVVRLIVDLAPILHSTG